VGVGSITRFRRCACDCSGRGGSCAGDGAFRGARGRGIVVWRGLVERDGEGAGWTEGRGGEGLGIEGIGFVVADEFEGMGFDCNVPVART
jgi:hypothetical protein